MRDNRERYIGRDPLFARIYANPKAGQMFAYGNDGLVGRKISVAHLAARAPWMMLA